MAEIRFRRCRPRAVAALLPVLLLAGCDAQLADRDPYFAGTNRKVAMRGAEIQEMVRYNRALQVARRACLQPAAGDETPDGPFSGPAGGREALARLCAARRGRPTEATGALLNAYDRWQRDRVRALPKASRTAAGAAGEN